MRAIYSLWLGNLPAYYHDPIHRGWSVRLMDEKAMMTDGVLET